VRVQLSDAARRGSVVHESILQNPKQRQPSSSDRFRLGRWRTRETD
jgi:hypothetical protein